MLVTLYRLYFLACIGCAAHEVGQPYRTYADCMHHRPTRLSYCVRSPNEWIKT